MPLRNLAALGVWIAVGATAVAAQQTAEPATKKTTPAATQPAATQPAAARPAAAAGATAPTPPPPHAAPIQPATVQPPDSAIASLHWTRLAGAGQCIAPDDLAARVEQIMREPVWAPAGHFVVEGWVIARLAPEHGFVTQVAIIAPDGQVLQRVRMSTAADNCRVLDDVLGRAVATGLVFAPPSFEPGHPESGAALSTPHLTPDFNPYMGTPPRAYRHASSSPQDMRREEPSPNPYTGHPDPTASLEPYFNPYTASGSARAVVAVLAEPGATHEPFEPPSNPYYGTPTSEAMPSFNPYRP